jgi:threonine synthase
MGYNAWFRCIKGCSEKYPLDEVVYQCGRCGALLEVVHDMKELKKKSAKEWTETFDDRIHKNLWPYGSGVWGKKEWICPNIDNENVVSLYEGNTNLFWAERFGKDIGLENLWIKMCGNSHSGSFKDLGMTVLVSMVKQMIANGKKINAVACASTGDTSAALATYCAAAGIQSIVFLPKGKVSIAQLIQPLANNSLVLSLETDFDGCMEIVQKICKDHNIYLANSMNSLRIEGQKTVSIEIVQQFDWQVPDVIIIPGGNLGNVSALGKGFLMMQEIGIINKLPRIVVAQAERANPLYLSYKTGFKEFKPVAARQTLASAIQIGHPVSYEKAVKILKIFNGIVEQATEDELANAAAKGDKYGMFNCPHTGVALAVLFKLLKSGEISPKEKVVVISTAHGLKFTDFKRDYHEGKIEGVTSRHANLPVYIPADIEKIKNVIYERIEKG